MSSVVFQAVTWVFWSFFAVGTVFFSAFLKSAPAQTNTFAPSSWLLPVGAALGVVLLGGGLRYLLSRMGHSGLAIIPYFLGIICCQMALFLGVFLAPEFLMVFQGLCVALFLAYLPAFLRPAKAV